MAPKIDISKQDLLDYYNIMELSTRQIANICGCSQGTIMYKMIKYDISRRSVSESMQGRKFTEETKKKISEALKGNNNSPKGEDNGNWKGDKAGIDAIHGWIKRRKPKPESCELCGENKKLELSNKDHKYSRNLGDYQYVCKLCHRRYDIKKGLIKTRWDNHAP